MSTAIFRHFIVHQIKRDSNNYATVKERVRENTIDEMTNTVATNLLELFNKTGLQTGSFDQEGGKPKFEQTLQKHFLINDGEFVFANFRQMTIDLARILEGEMNKGAGKAAKPTYVVFFHHTINGIDYLTVITLLETQGFVLRNLSFRNIDRLELDKLHLAARIRLNDWHEGLDERYISFRIGRNSEMRDYFKEFVGCEEFTAAKIETKDLVNAIKICCKNLYKDNEEKIHYTLELAEVYCKKNKDEDGKVNLSSLGRHLFPDNDNYLLEIAQGEDFKLSERVSIYNRGLKALIRYRGQDKTMNISFDSDLLNSQVVVYNKETGVLIFNKIPKSLRDSLAGN